MRKFIYGASGHAKVILDNLLSSNIKIEGVYDDNPNLNVFLNQNFLGVLNQINKEDTFIIGIGDNAIRKKISSKVDSYFNAIHKSTTISNFISLGSGNAVMANAIVNSGSKIGNHCIINTAAVVEHDCVLEDFTHVAPNATLTGAVSIGIGTLVGAGTVVLPGIKIGKWVTIGAGSVVTKDIPDYAVVHGTPARIQKYNEPKY